MDMVNIIKLLETIMEDDTPDESVVDGLLNSIQHLKFGPLKNSIWNSIREEGLDEEQDAPNKAQWVMAKLPISETDVEKLKEFDDDTIELFNLFDIRLKEKYNSKIIDLIDYDAGTVTLVKVFED